MVSTTEQEIQVGLETDEKYEVLGGITEADEILLPEINHISCS